MPESIPAGNAEVEKLKQQAMKNVPVNKLAGRDRVTVRFAMLLQHFGESAVGVETSYERYLETVDQSLDRRIAVTSEPQPIKMEWVAEPGLVVIHNRVGAAMVSHPTEEEKAELAAKIICVGDPNGFFDRIPPKEVRFYDPGDWSKVRIWCLGGDAVARLFLTSR